MSKLTSVLNSFHICAHTHTHTHTHTASQTPSTYAHTHTHTQHPKLLPHMRTHTHTQHTTHVKQIPVTWEKQRHLLFSLSYDKANKWILPFLSPFPPFVHGYMYLNGRVGRSASSPPPTTRLTNEMQNKFHHKITSPSYIVVTCHR